jgi:hypothetical protein
MEEDCLMKKHYLGEGMLVGLEAVYMDDPIRLPTVGRMALVEDECFPLTDHTPTQSR